MLVLHLNIYMLPFVFHIEAFFWHTPSVAGIIEEVLMEVTYFVAIRLVYLAEAFVCDYLFDVFPIHF